MHDTNININRMLDASALTYFDDCWPPTLILDLNDYPDQELIEIPQTAVIEMQKIFASHRIGNTPQYKQEQPAAPYDSPDISGETASPLGSNF